MEKLISKDVESINDLIEKLRLGEIDGTIEILINNKGKINRVLIRKQKEERIKKEIKEEIKKVKLSNPDLSHADFSETDLTGSDFSGIDLHEADFSYSRIGDSDLSKTNLRAANFYKTELDHANFSNAYSADLRNSYLTGSVNLYNAAPAGESMVTNPYDGGAQQEAEEYDEDEHALHPEDMSKVGPSKKRKNY